MKLFWAIFLFFINVFSAFSAESLQSEQSENQYSLQWMKQHWLKGREVVHTSPKGEIRARLFERYIIITRAFLSGGFNFVYEAPQTEDWITQPKGVFRNHPAVHGVNRVEITQD